MTSRFVKHAGNMINLGLNSSAYWIRFTVDAFQVQINLRDNRVLLQSLREIRIGGFLT